MVRIDAPEVDRVEEQQSQAFSGERRTAAPGSQAANTGSAMPFIGNTSIT
jgi:hypothetical protein